MSLLSKFKIGSFVAAVIGAFSAGQSEIPKSLLTKFSLKESPHAIWRCDSRHYSIELVSIDPMVIYINDFVTSAEVQGLLDAGEANFHASEVSINRRKRPTNDRTSLSAGLPLSNPFVDCILSRARSFLGSTMHPTRDHFGIPQLVRYTAGQKFDVHHDWYERPHRLADGRPFNRPASFFVYLQDNCTEGETWFPYIEQLEDNGNLKWREHKDGGVAFTPISGNAVFWVNLFKNGTGDGRVVHAGLPIGEGVKTAMNIWPRTYYE